MKINIRSLLRYLSDKYGIEVEIKDTLEDGIEIAQLKNKKILINQDSRDELGILFVIAHLFGHMVQFERYDDYRHLLEPVKAPKPLVLSEDFKKAFYAYEVEGYRIGKGLIEHALGENCAREIDEKYQIYLDTDFTLYWEYLTTGVQSSAKEFNEELYRNFINWKGNYRKTLEAIEPPDSINFRSDVVANID